MTLRTQDNLRKYLLKNYALQNINDTKKIESLAWDDVCLVLHTIATQCDVLQPIKIIKWSYTDDFSTYNDSSEQEIKKHMTSGTCLFVASKESELFLENAKITEIDGKPQTDPQRRIKLCNGNPQKIIPKSIRIGMNGTNHPHKSYVHHIFAQGLSLIEVVYQLCYHEALFSESTADGLLLTHHKIISHVDGSPDVPNHEQEQNNMQTALIETGTGRMQPSIDSKILAELHVDGKEPTSKQMLALYIQGLAVRRDMHRVDNGVHIWYCSSEQKPVLQDKLNKHKNLLILVLDEIVWGLHFRSTKISTKKIVNVYHNGNAGQQHTDTADSDILEVANALYTIEIDNSNDHNVWPTIGKVPTTARFVDTAYMLRELMVPMVSLGREPVTPHTPHTDTIIRCTLTDIYHALPSMDTVKVPDVMDKLSLIGIDNVTRAQLSAMRDGVTLSHQSRPQDKDHNDNKSAYSMCHHDMRYLHPATDTPAFHSRLLGILGHIPKNNPGCQGFVVLHDHTTPIQQRHILLHYLMAESSCLFKMHTYPDVVQNWLSNGWIILQMKQDWEEQEQKFCRPCVIVAP